MRLFSGIPRGELIAFISIFMFLAFFITYSLVEKMYKKSKLYERNQERMRFKKMGISMNKKDKK